MATPQENELYKGGFLEKRQRGRKHPHARNLYFQKRYCKLTSCGLEYYKDNKLKDSFQISRIKIIQAVDESVFKGKNYCFQIGDDEEVLYFACSSFEERSDWISKFEQAAKSNNNVMLSRHHTGKYSRWTNKWMCCDKEKSESGCVLSQSLERTVSRRSKSKYESLRAVRSQGDAYLLEPLSPEILRSKSLNKDSRDSGYISTMASNGASLESVNLASSSMGKNMVRLQSFVPTHDQKILSMKFISQDVLVLGMDNSSVHLYDIPSNIVIHNIRLTHPISSIDVWSGYLLIGSSVVHVVDTREDHWRRILVVDMDEKESLKNLPQHFAVFSSDGKFATASMSRNKIALWPQPVKSGGLMTEKKMNYSCEPDMELISGVHSLLSTKKGDSDVLVVLCKMYDGRMRIDVIQWGQQLTLPLMHLETLPLPSTFVPTLSLSADGRCIAAKVGNKIRQWTKDRNVQKYSQNLELEGNEVSSISHKGSCILLGLKNGKTEVFENKQKTIFPAEKVSVTAVAVSADSTCVAIGFEDGKLHLWGDSGVVLGPKRQDLEIAEITMFSVYLPGSFSRHSLITNKFSFKADSRGGKFTNRPSYSLTIPKGAIKEGETVNIQTGLITCVGNDRFQFPDNCRVVSSVVWFCADNEEQFRESLTIELQHCSQDSSNIRVLKAKCSTTANVYKFEPLDCDGNSQGTEYVTFKTNHFCLYCIGVYTTDVENPTRICVVPIERPYISKEKEVIFCVCYDLDTCKRAVEEQYENKIENTVHPPIPVSLAADSDRISFDFSFKLGGASVALKSGTNQILARDLHFTHMSLPELATAHRRRTYPPRVSFSICTGSDNMVVRFTFAGLRQEKLYEVNLQCIACASSVKDPSPQASVPHSSETEEGPFREPSFRPFH